MHVCIHVCAWSLCVCVRVRACVRVCALWVSRFLFLQQTSLASRNLALVQWSGVCSDGDLLVTGQSHIKTLSTVWVDCFVVLVAPGNDSSQEERVFALFGVAVWHCEAFVVVLDVIFHQISGHGWKVCWSTWSDLVSLFVGNQECICWHCWLQPLNPLVNEGEKQLFKHSQRAGRSCLYRRPVTKPSELHWIHSNLSMSTLIS